jgi:hypothetical protein
MVQSSFSDMVRPARLLGASRLAPAGPPWNGVQRRCGAVERDIVLCRAFDPSTALGALMVQSSFLSYREHG